MRFTFGVAAMLMLLAIAITFANRKGTPGKAWEADAGI
jgi:hypothetical protein